MEAKINSVEVNRGKNGVYIVLEAGATHYGLESAKKLVEVAKDACANAVKFQFLSADRLIADKSVMFEYAYLERDTEGNEQFVSRRERLYDILKRRELGRDEWRDLKRYCDETGIPLFLTATYNDEVDFMVDELELNSVKINSSDINEIGFIKYCASKGINVQLDTGNADIWEIDRAVTAVEEEGCKNIIIHHCPSGYPARLESIHLNMIKTLKTMFPNYSIAFSDHSPGWEMDIAAVALGADMVEKTITLDRTIKSCEHSFSLEPEEAKRFVESIRELEIALGSTRRRIPYEMMKKRKSTRRSPYALKDMDTGYIITETDFECKRPGYGITSEEFRFFVGKKLIKGMNKGEALTYDCI
jgi:N,N'-diacetyllegionaminate synthase